MVVSMQAKPGSIDTPFLVLGLLLAVTLLAFLTGVFPYPFGFFILGFAMLGRYLQLRSKK
jgi:dihydroxy-acid dehydratase